MNPLDELEYRIDHYEGMDPFDRQQTRLQLMLLNQNNRESMSLYAKAAQQGIV